MFLGIQEIKQVKMTSKFQCEKCDKEFDTKNEAEKHEKNCSLQKRLNLSEKLSLSGTTKKMFSLEQDKSKSQDSENIPNSKKCRTCGKYVGLIPNNTYDGEKFCSWKCRKAYQTKTLEWKCKCNSCGHVWHYLDKVEKTMKKQVGYNTCTSLAICNPCVTMAASNANTNLMKQMNDLKSCPKCGSSNVTKEAIFFDKK